MNLRLTTVLSMVLLLCSLHGCSNDAEAPLVASNVQVTKPLPGATMSAGFMTLQNNGSDTIRITGVTSPQFRSIEIHESTLENDIARMRRVNELSIAPGDSVQLQRGGLHLMLMGASEDISDVTLNLYSDDLLILTLRTTTGN